MDVNAIKKISGFLADATPVQLRAMAEDIAEKSPYFLVNHIDESNNEKAIEYIKLHILTLGDIAKHEKPDYAVGYVEGLIDLAFISGSIDNNTKENLVSKFKLKLKELDMEDI